MDAITDFSTLKSGDRVIWKSRFSGFSGPAEVKRRDAQNRIWIRIDGDGFSFIPREVELFTLDEKEPA